MLDLDAAGLAAAYRDRRLSPVEATRAVLDRAAALQPTLNAFAAFDDDGALAAARQSEARWRAGQPLGPLDGVPISVKDLMTAAGMPTRLGSRAVGPDDLPRIDAPAVARCRQAGAVIFGKTTTSEFGNLIVTQSQLHGITRNPWDPGRTSGGSSGGAGVAAATGLGPIAIATDGGGSIRIPAAWNGVVGFKPSYKRVPTAATEGFGRLSHVGPIARRVADIGLAMTVMTQSDGGDWQAAPADGTDYMPPRDPDLTGLRIAYSRDLGLAAVPDDIAAPVAAAARLLAGLGAEVHDVGAVPALAGYVDSRLHSIQWMVNLAQRVQAYDDEHRALIGPEVMELAAIGAELPLAAYVAALDARERLGRAMHAFLTDYDVLVCPTFHADPPPVPGLPPELREAPRLTSWCNQTLQPAASLPCGFSATGMPVGLQIVARRYADAKVLRVAAAFEAARGPFSAAPLPAGVQ